LTREQRPIGRRLARARPLTLWCSIDYETGTTVAVILFRQHGHPSAHMLAVAAATLTTSPPSPAALRATFERVIAGGSGFDPILTSPGWAMEATIILDLPRSIIS